MDGNKKVITIGLVGLVIAVIIVLLAVKHNNNKATIKNYNTVISATVQEGKNTWEVHKSYTGQLVLITLNGEIREQKSFAVEAEERQILRLPDTAELTGKNITDKEQFSKSTWDGSLNEAAEQVKWFENSGYKMELKAETQEFIEIYMRNEKSEYKRILIMQGQISVADVHKYTFKTINEYII